MEGQQFPQYPLKTTTSRLKSLNTKTKKYGIENQKPGLGQTPQCNGLNPLMGFHPSDNWLWIFSMVAISSICKQLTNTFI